MSVRTQLLGLGWRPETAGVAAVRRDLGFVEVVVESLPAHVPLPLGLAALQARGVELIPHGVGLSLGEATRPTPERIERLADAVTRLDAPVVSEHLAFVRAGGVGAGHLLPMPRTRAAIDVLVENILVVQDQLPVPLAVEPVASVFEWPGAELDEADFVAEVVERSGALLLLDLANLFVNSRNFGFDALAHLDRLPLDRLAYAHVAGGRVAGGVHHDTHAHQVWPEVFELTRELVARVPCARVMLERDDRFGGDDDLHAELDLLASAMADPAPHRDRAPAPPVRPGVRSVPDADEQDDLARAQHALVAALVHGAPAPTGFDAERIDVARRSLVDKRAREVAAAWPVVVAALGASYGELFARHAGAHAAPASGGAVVDGAWFVVGLDRAWFEGDDEALAARAEACRLVGGDARTRRRGRGRRRPIRASGRP